MKSLKPKTECWFFPGLIVTDISTRTSFLVVGVKDSVVFLQDIFADSGLDCVVKKIDGRKIVDEDSWLYENFEINEQKQLIPNSVFRTFTFVATPMRFEFAEKVSGFCSRELVLKQIIDHRVSWIVNKENKPIVFNDTRPRMVAIEGPKFLSMTLGRKHYSVSNFLSHAYLADEQ